MPILKKCQHIWRLDNKDIFDAPIEAIRQSEQFKPEPWMYVRGVSLTYVCTKCGEIQNVSTTFNPEQA